MSRSNAVSGVGTKVYRGTGNSSSPVFEEIAEISRVSGPNMSKATIDVTHLGSTGGYREFIGSFRDGGQVTLEMNFTLAGYSDIKGDFDDDDLRDYKIVLPNTEATEIEFTALVTDLGMEIPLADKISASCTFKISGQTTITS
ncbi:MAG: outer capsid protein Hoc [Gammaproteobacteria bacterium]|nr:outer capsid protein Hoc [Gammaproteobacteria bacterium]